MQMECVRVIRRLRGSAYMSQLRANRVSFELELPIFYYVTLFFLLCLGSSSGPDVKSGNISFISCRERPI